MMFFVFLFLVVAEIALAFFTIGGPLAPLLEHLPIETYALKTFVVSLVIWCPVIMATTRKGLLSISEESDKEEINVLAVILFCVEVVGLFAVYYFHPASFSYIYYKGSMYGTAEHTEYSIREAIGLDPDNTRYLCAAGNVYYNAGDFDKAVYYYNKALSEKENDAKINFLLGRAYRKRGRVDIYGNDRILARDFLENAVKGKPQKKEYNYELALAWYDLGYYHEEINSCSTALEHFHIAIGKSCKKAEYFFWRGNCYLMLNRNIEAVNDFSEAIRLAPDTANYYYWRGRAYVYQDNWASAEKAVEDFDEAISKIKANADYYYWRGRAYSIIGSDDSLEKAITDYTEAINRDDGIADYYAYRSLAYSKLDRAAEGKNDIVKALELDENNSWYLYRAGIMDYNAKWYGNAIQELKQAAELSGNASYYFDLGDAYYKNMQYNDAIDAFSKAIELDPSSTLYLSRRLYCYLLLGEIELAKSDAIEIMKFDNRWDIGLDT